MLKYILCYLLATSLSLSEGKKVTEIVRYKLGDSECSHAIILRGNKYFHNSCKWGKEKYQLISDKATIDFILSIDKQMVANQSKVSKKDKCAISKYTYLISLGDDKYTLDEALCEQDANGILVNKLHKIFKCLAG